MAKNSDKLYLDIVINEDVLNLANQAWESFTNMHTIENRTLKEMFIFGFCAGRAIGLFARKQMEAQIAESQAERKD